MKLLPLVILLRFDLWQLIPTTRPSHMFPGPTAIKVVISPFDQSAPTYFGVHFPAAIKIVQRGKFLLRPLLNESLQPRCSVALETQRLRKRRLEGS